MARLMGLPKERTETERIALLAMASMTNAEEDARSFWLQWEPLPLGMMSYLNQNSREQANSGNSDEPGVTSETPKQFCMCKEPVFKKWDRCRKTKKHVEMSEEMEAEEPCPISEEGGICLKWEMTLCPCKHDAMFDHPCTLKYQVSVIRKIFRDIPEVTLSLPFSAPMADTKSRTRADIGPISEECIEH